MGEARKLNVNSPQYRGPMPDTIVSGAVRTRVGVDAAWLEANKPAEGRPSVPIPEDKQFVEWQLVGVLVIPSMLVPREQWPTCQVDLGVVGGMSLSEFKRRAMTPDAPAVVAPDGQGAETL